MAKPIAGGVGREIEELWAAGRAGALDDSALLRTFLRRGAGAEAAFEALVRRHGPMVLRVCRGVTRDLHAAQDAAQVTFLVLARNAGSIRDRRSLASWLFGTARRVAGRSVRDEARRRSRERRLAQSDPARASDVGPRADRRDWSALHDELARLPERYRMPLVLCDLEGRSHEEAADAIGCPVRTLQTRLYRGRERLRGRLVARGYSAALASAAPALGTMAVPESWARSTAASAVRLASGCPPIDVVPAASAGLIEEVTRIMVLSRSVRLGLVPILGLALVGLARLASGADPANPQETGPPAVTKKAAEPKPARETSPITVTGRATDPEGRPIAGATVYLVSTNVIDAPVGSTTTGEDGTYAFRDVLLPIARSRPDSHPAGTFQVYGTAPGRGWTWRGMRHYEPHPRPDDRRVSGEDYSLFQGEPLSIDLTFPPAATLRGRLLDEAGNPIVGAKLRVTGCDYLDTQGRESHHNYREFWSVRNVPEAFPTRARTGPDGRFHIEGVPREAGFLIEIQHPDFAGQSLYAATTARAESDFTYPLGSIVPGSPRPRVWTGDIDLTLHAVRRVEVRTVLAETGRPVAGIRVSAGNDSGGVGAYGKSDVNGTLVLKLPPGEYDVTADPPSAGLDVIRTRAKLTVAAEPAEQTLEIRVERGAVLVLEAVDEKTGQGIAGVTFMVQEERRGRRIRTSVQSNTAFVDNPRTDIKGQIRAVVPPGEHTYSLGYVPEITGYRHESLEERVNLEAGKTTTLRFELRK